jgi:sigma-B regulation protein RsbU (phosphoserine phosphatase)
MSSETVAEVRADTQVWGAEKEEAYLIQRSLLPVGYLRGSSFEVAYRFTPRAEVGGDFADFFYLPNGLVGLYIGDVVGKGLPAAMYGAMVMGMLRGINKTGEHTASVLAMLNKRLNVRPVPGRFCATLYALFNPATRELMFSNAGLPFPLLVSGTGVVRLGDGGIPSGMFPEVTYDVHSVRLYSGDAILFASDGLHELLNTNGEEFGAARLQEVWGECGWKSADESLDHLFDAAKTFSQGARQHDDITAVVLKVPQGRQNASHLREPQRSTLPRQKHSRP